MSHVPHTHESRHSVVRMSHVPQMNEPCHTSNWSAVVAVNDLKNTYMCVCVCVCMCVYVCVFVT